MALADFLNLLEPELASRAFWCPAHGLGLDLLMGSGRRHQGPGVRAGAWRYRVGASSFDFEGESWGLEVEWGPVPLTLRVSLNHSRLPLPLCTIARPQCFLKLALECTCSVASAVSDCGDHGR